MKRVAIVGIGPLCLLLMLGSALAQSNNLVKNPNGEEGLNSWRVFGNASASEASAGKGFSIMQDAFIFQDIDPDNNPIGMYALFISFASIERVSSDRRIGQPYMHGYFMTGGDLRHASLLANLAGQEMASQPAANGEWVKQFGVFRVPEQTGRIRIFLRGGCGKTETSTNCVSHFRSAGIFLFGSEEQAKAFAESYQ